MNEAIKNLMFDLSTGREIYDVEQDRVITAQEANDTLVRFCSEELGLSKDSTPRQIMRAFESEKGKQFFQIIEEIIDKTIKTGWHETEFFNNYVDERNLADGDKNEFWNDGPEVILTVAKVAGDHHDLTVQRLGQGSSESIPTAVYAVKVGSMIREFVTGRKNWSDFTTALANAFIKEVQDSIYASFTGAAALIPESAQFNKTGALGSSTKTTFDTLLDDVSMANDNVPVVIMGTKAALRKLNALNDINFRSDAVKDAVSGTGILGDYEGITLLELPQRFKKNDISQKLMDDTKLYIMPQVDNKFVKFVDYGESVLTVDQKGDKMDDRQTYEVQRRMGTGVIITKRFGTWTITA